MDCKIRKFEDWKRYCSLGVHVFIVKLTSTVKLTSLFQRESMRYYNLLETKYYRLKPFNTFLPSFSATKLLFLCHYLYKGIYENQMKGFWWAYSAFIQYHIASLISLAVDCLQQRFIFIQNDIFVHIRKRKRSQFSQHEVYKFILSLATAVKTQSRHDNTELLLK